MTIWYIFNPKSILVKYKYIFPIFLLLRAKLYNLVKEGGPIVYTFYHKEDSDYPLYKFYNKSMVDESLKSHTHMDPVIGRPCGYLCFHEYF